MIAFSWGNPRLLIRPFNQIPSFGAYARAINFAFVVDKAIVGQSVAF